MPGIDYQRLRQQITMRQVLDRIGFQATWQRGPRQKKHEEFNHADRIPLELKRVALRIVQESLANACRHSKSKRLFVELTVDGDVLRIRIRD